MKKLLVLITLLLAFTVANAQWSEFGKGMVFKSTFNYNSRTGVRNYDAPIEFYLLNGDLKIVYVDGRSEKYYAPKNNLVDERYNKDGMKYYTYKFISYYDGKAVFFQIFRHSTNEGNQIVRLLYSDGYMEFQE